MHDSAKAPGESVKGQPRDWPATDVRFSDALRVGMHGNTIVISNANTGEFRAFSKELEELLNSFMNWTGMEDALLRGLPEEPAPEAVNKAVAAIHDLMMLGVLETRQHEHSGTRLPHPGRGWTEAMRFLLDTRTTKETIWAVPVEFYAALAEKSVFCRQPSAFYERVTAKFHPLSQPLMHGTGGSIAFEDVMLKRRTSRRFAARALSESELSTLLYFSWGMTGAVENPLSDVFVRKTSPSGGSLHPIEVYPVVLNVDGVAPGCYHYSVRRHGLEELLVEDPKPWIVDACGDQEWVAEAGVIFVCTAFLPRTAWKYDYSRVARAVISEIGYTGQSAFLTAAWLGLGVFTTMALRDEIFEEKLGLEPAREPVFSVTGAGHLEPEVPDHTRPRKESMTGVEGSA